MAFGKRASAAWRRTPVRVSPPIRRRRAWTTALFGLALGFAGMGAATTMVRASERGIFAEMFDALFGPPKPAAAPVAAPVEMPRKTPRRYSALPDARSLKAGRSLAQQTPRIRARAIRPPVAEAAAGPGPAPLKGTQTVCVRLCDGYAFPLGRLRNPTDLPVHQAACAAACPGTRTDLFTLASGQTEFEQAVSLAGQPYLSAAWANLYRTKRVAHCACRPAGATGPLPSAAEDPTVRAGDVFATADSAEVVTAVTRTGPVLSDYREAGITEVRRRAIEARVGAIGRDADAAAFRRVLRLAENRALRIRTAEAQVVRLRRDGAEPGFGFSEPREAGAGFRPVRVVAPSPFER